MQFAVTATAPAPPGAGKARLPRLTITIGQLRHIPESQRVPVAIGVGDRLHTGKRNLRSTETRLERQTDVERQVGSAFALGCPGSVDSALAVLHIAYSAVWRDPGQ